MKISYILYFLLILFLLSNKVYAENLTISFVDIDKIISQSNAGKKIQKSFDTKIKKENEKFAKIEKDLKNKEQDILKKKNILSKEELDKEIKDFQSTLSKFRKQRAEFNRNMTKKNLESTNKMVSEINKILTKYASDNSISLVIQKKHIIIGKSDLDITEKILKEFNDKIKSVE
tara:strand:- start:4 stop:525 length:522 start_codon:yes stop_codon:yes gene_type:complete